jgi:hypothetical protein
MANASDRKKRGGSKGGAKDGAKRGGKKKRVTRAYSSLISRSKSSGGGVTLAPSPGGGSRPRPPLP